MDSFARDTYWETQILTASPQKLRLMLIDGAIRCSRQVIQYWSEERFSEAFDSMMRGQNIVFELMNTVPKTGAELNQRIIDVYLFLYKSLVTALPERNSKKVEDVIKVLETERETWRLVCEKFPEALKRQEIEQLPPQEITAGHMPAIHAQQFGMSGQLPINDNTLSPGSTSFSLDA